MYTAPMFVGTQPQGMDIVPDSTSPFHVYLTPHTRQCGIASHRPRALHYR